MTDMLERELEALSAAALRYDARHRKIPRIQWPDGVRIALGCVSSVPVRATAMESALAAGDLSEQAVRAAAAGLGASLDPPSDVHASADYRRHLAEVSAVRAVLQAAERAKGQP